MTKPTTSLTNLVDGTTKPWWPSLCTEAYFRRLVAACETAYLANGRGRLPDIKQICTYMGRSPSEKKIASILLTDEFATAMSNRGINWTSKAVGITPEQTYALGIMTDPSLSRLGFGTRLKRAGISYHKWQSWMRQPLFSTAFQNLTESNLADSVGIAHTALIGKAAEGDMRAVEFLYQITGRFDPQREANMNMQAIVLGILEILTRRITDPIVLEAISEDMASLVSGKTPTAIDAVVVTPPEKSEPAVSQPAESVFTFDLR